MDTFTKNAFVPIPILTFITSACVFMMYCHELVSIELQRPQLFSHGQAAVEDLWYCTTKTVLRDRMTQEKGEGWGHIYLQDIENSCLHT